MTAATAVAAIIAGWGLAQRPQFLPGLTIEPAAAGRSVLIATLVALGLGAVILLPSLGLLYALLLRGHFDEGPPLRNAGGTARAPRTARLLPVAGVCLIVGLAATVPVTSSWGRIVGIPFLLAFIGLGLRVDRDGDEHRRGGSSLTVRTRPWGIDDLAASQFGWTRSCRSSRSSSCRARATAGRAPTRAKWACTASPPTASPGL